MRQLSVKEVRHFKEDLQYNEGMDFDEMEQINKNE